MEKTSAAKTRRGNGYVGLTPSVDSESLIANICGTKNQIALIGWVNKLPCRGRCKLATVRLNCHRRIPKLIVALVPDYVATPRKVHGFGRLGMPSFGKRGGDGHLAKRGVGGSDDRGSL